MPYEGPDIGAHYGMREAEIDVARNISKRDLPLWVNFEWKYEDAKRVFMDRLANAKKV